MILNNIYIRTEMEKTMSDLYNIDKYNFSLIKYTEIYFEQMQ